MFGYSFAALATFLTVASTPWPARNVSMASAAPRPPDTPVMSRVKDIVNIHSVVSRKGEDGFDFDSSKLAKRSELVLT